MRIEPEARNDAGQAAPNRRAARPGEVIDRGAPLSFSFDGKTYTACAGDTIASALASAGVRVLSRSFKYHRPRGVLCCAGHCPNCLVQVGDEPNVRACQRPVEAGMEVQAQNVWPSLDRDLLSLTGLADRLMPVGFYYKTFIRPRAMWPFYERVLRRAAGLGRVSRHAPPGRFDKQYLHADVAVVGGGPAGMSAALAAAERGARVLLFDENPGPGGHLRFAGSGEAQGVLSDLTDAVGRQANLTVLNGTAVLGWYLDNWLSAVRGTRLFKVRTRSMVVATGAYEMPLVFDNNDLPGVMLGSAAQRLLHLYGVVPGKRAVVVTANDGGWEVAAQLREAGMEVVAVTDTRGADACSSAHAEGLAADGVPAFFEHTILSARGTKGVEGAVICRVGAGGDANPTPGGTFACDTIAVCMGWTPDLGLAYMAGGRSVYDERRAEMTPGALPPGIYAAGRAAGTQGVDAQMLEGRLAGANAAAFVGMGPAAGADEVADLADRKAGEPVRTSACVSVPGKKKRFVCFCEDVTDEDVRTAIAEGYDSMELLKRYSTISMGPCQGRMCSMNTLHLCARANGRPVQETGRTTSRPPVVPVTLGALAGQRMEPVQVSPVHGWHLERGARMLVAGRWLRPEHYGDPEAEVRAVRERVGLIDVSPLGKLRVTGPGAPALLERLYINQWHDLAVGRVRYGVMCNDEGVILDDGVCARVGPEEWYLSTTSTGAAGAFEWVQWWVQSGWGDGVHVNDLTETFSAFNLAGPRSREVLAKLTSRDLSGKRFAYMRVRPAVVAGVRCRVLRIGFTGELSYEIHCPSGSAMHLWEALMEAGQEFGMVPFGVEAQRVLRLEKAHLIVGQDTDALSDALSADLAWAVKLDKPDFLGKRSLVRVSKAGVRQRLVGFRLARKDARVEEGLQVVRPGEGGKPELVGWITSSRFSPTLGEAIGLCWLPVELADRDGASFTVYRDGDLVEALVHHGAFYDPKGERLRG